ncbi:PIN domain-containing protein [soil metagenome]
MRALFDTNVILDLLLARDPFLEPAQQLFSLVEKGEIIGFLGATTVTTIHYLSVRQLGTKQAHKELDMLLQLFEIAPVNRTVLVNALETKFADFEDAVLYQAACLVGANTIVSRDKAGFKHATLSVYTPQELLNILV